MTWFDPGQEVSTSSKLLARFHLHNAILKGWVLPGPSSLDWERRGLWGIKSGGKLGKWIASAKGWKMISNILRPPKSSFTFFNNDFNRKIEHKMYFHISFELIWQVSTIKHWLDLDFSFALWCQIHTHNQKTIFQTNFLFWKRTQYTHYRFPSLVGGRFLLLRSKMKSWEVPTLRKIYFSWKPAGATYSVPGIWVSS